MTEKKRKAYKITTIGYDGWVMYSAESAGKAKTLCFYGLRDAYDGATYAWIKSCRRAPTCDDLAEKYTGCLAWEDGHDHWDVVDGMKRV